eukprot:848464-Rhodomonas_salina.3
MLSRASNLSVEVVLGLAPSHPLWHEKAVSLLSPSLRKPVRGKLQRKTMMYQAPSELKISQAIYLCVDLLTTTCSSCGALG